MDNRLGYGMRSSPADFGEIIAQRSKRSCGFPSTIGPPPERRSTISNMHTDCHGLPNSNSCSRMRNLSGGSVGSTASGSSTGSCSNLDNQYSSNSYSQFPIEIAPFANTRSAAVNSPTTVPAGSTHRGFSSPSFVSSSCNHQSCHHHRSSRSERGIYNDTDNGSTTPDRHGSSSSSSSQQQSQRSVNSSRYKTELCRPFEESGSCKYGDKCQFAHGMHELRNLSRHPKYKTELCRTFHTIGYCPYGPRCHFIHEEEPTGGKVADQASLSPKLARSRSMQSSSGSSSPSLSPSGCSEVSNFVFQQRPDNRQFNALSVNINSTGSSFDALDRQLGLLNLNNSRDAPQGDIFSQANMFSEKELLDNGPQAPPASSIIPPSFQRQQLDNFPAFSEGPYWPSAFCGSEELLLSRMLGSLGSDNHNHSPTGSTTDGISSSGSDSGSSDCGGSTENLNSNAFSELRSPVAIGQY